MPRCALFPREIFRRDEEDRRRRCRRHRRGGLTNPPSRGATATGHADAVLFGGGIGEHMPAVRAAILDGLEELGLHLDPLRNEKQREGDGRVSAEDSKIEIWALATDEESIIARDAIRLLEPGT